MGKSPHSSTDKNPLKLSITLRTKPRLPDTPFVYIQYLFCVSSFLIETLFNLEQCGTQQGLGFSTTFISWSGLQIKAELSSGALGIILLTELVQLRGCNALLFHFPPSDCMKWRCDGWCSSSHLVVAR